MTMKQHTIAFAALLIAAYCCSCANSMHQAVEPVRSSQNLTGVHRDQWYCLNPDPDHGERLESKAVDPEIEAGPTRKKECTCGQQEQAVLLLKAEIDGYSHTLLWLNNFGADNDYLPKLQRRAKAFREAAAKLQQETKKKLRKVEQRMAHLHCLGNTCHNRASKLRLSNHRLAYLLAKRWADQVDGCKQDPKGDNCATCNIVYKDGVLVAEGEAATIAYKKERAKKIADKKRHRMHTLRQGLKNKMTALHKLKGKHMNKLKDEQDDAAAADDDDESYECYTYKSESDCVEDNGCTWDNDACKEEQEDDED